MPNNTVVSNIIRNISATLINIVAPLIAIPLLTSGLGIEFYGVYVALLAKAALFSVLTELGFSMYMTKEISIHRNDIAKISSLTWMFLIVKLSLSLLTLMVLHVSTTNFGLVEWLLYAIIVLNLINITPIISGLEQYNFLTKIQVSTKLLIISLILIIDFSRSGLEKALALQALVSGLTSFSLLIYLIKVQKIKFIKFSFSELIATLQGSLPFYGAKLLVNLYQQSSTYFVSFLLSAELVAIYSISIQLYKIGQSVIGAIARVLYTSTVKTKNFIFIKKVTLLSLLVHLGALPIVFLYGPNILSSIFNFNINQLFDLSFVLYLSLLFVILSSYWGYPALTAINKQSYAHFGILMSSFAYFTAFGFFYTLNIISIKSVTYCIVIADMTGMITRVYFAKKFKLI